MGLGGGGAGFGLGLGGASDARLTKPPPKLPGRLDGLDPKPPRLPPDGRDEGLEEKLGEERLWLELLR